MPTFWLVVLIITIGIIVAGAIWGNVRRLHNNAQPQVSVKAKIMAIDKRDSGKFIRQGTRTTVNLHRVYYITFALLPDGGRKKLSVPVFGHELLAVGDVGTLILQGTRYINFECNRQQG